MMPMAGDLVRNTTVLMLSTSQGGQEELESEYKDLLSFVDSFDTWASDAVLFRSVYLPIGYSVDVLLVFHQCKFPSVVICTV